MRKLNYVLLCTLVYCMVNPLYVWTQTSTTLNICSGESVFLDAVQTFPTPPQPPQGPDGSIPSIPCTPQLNGIDILPLNNVAATSLAGYTVSPTETTIYTITSNGVCGGPGSANFGEETITYEVVVETNCGSTPVPIDATLIICQGQSAFLEAIQTFPTPPQPPQGPDGGIPVTPCTPQLNGIDILPLDNVVATSLAGYTVSPTETTIYTITSNGFCGAPGFANSGELSITYEVVVDNACSQTEPTNVINQFPWLTGIFDPDFCNGESVVVYQQGSFQYLLVTDASGNEQLYFENGDFYCQGTPTYDCVAAFGFMTEVGRWNCGDGVDNCGSEYGTFFFDECAGQTFFFIQLDDGRIFDPYFAEGISFNPQEGQTILFDFSAADFSTPCTIAEAAIIITCLTIVPADEGNIDLEIGLDELTITAIFPQYSSWIGSFIDVSNCQGETVTVYTKGGYEFILIKDANGVERLYLEDGSFYCQNTNNYDCMTAYGFEEMVNYWECNFEAPIDPEIIFTDYPWLNDIVVEEGCVTELIEVYESGGYHYLLVTTNGMATLYFEDGTFYCQSQEGYSCNIVYGFGQPILTWLCGAAFSELPTTNFVSASPSMPSLNIYPNPTNGLINVPIEFSENIQSLRLIDLYGKTISTRNVSTTASVNNLTFDLTAYPSGVYYVEWTSGVERSVKKVVRR